MKKILLGRDIKIVYDFVTMVADVWRGNRLIKKLTTLRTSMFH